MRRDLVCLFDAICGFEHGQVGPAPGNVVGRFGASRETSSQLGGSNTAGFFRFSEGECHGWSQAIGRFLAA